MRSNRFLLLLCAIVLCFYSVAAAPQFQLIRRQDDNTARPAPTASESSRATSTSARERSSSTQVSSSSSSSNPKETSSATPASSSALATTTTSNAPSVTVSQSPVTGPSHGLPNQPKITPALGMAGVIFIISGAVYAVIGIKNKWLYVFTSAAYLTGLAVTVLIVYLMSPPVSNAVQGAFFVAACLSGLIFGALALVFADITDGLGCMLGGFCLSMWLLTLKEGGLIESPGGRAVLIGCMTIAGYGLSWSHYTREYGLIACISFAGSTIVMLGIDCFSRAGLKEFWLYLWNLNPDVFPLYTNTYPMTRGMKAELAGTIILAIFGIVSQLRVWKLVKEHREKSTSQELERARDQELEEEERGRKIEDKFQEERAQWEATYNQKNSHDSGSEDSIRDEKSMHAKDGETFVNKKDGSVKSVRKETAVTVTVLNENEIEQIDESGKPLPQPPDAVHLGSGKASDIGSVRTSTDTAARSQISRITRQSLQPSAPPPPVVVPLPFKIPQEEDAKSQVSDNASVSAVPDVEDDLETNQQSVSKRISDMSGMRRMSTNRQSSAHFESEEAVCSFPIEADRASSVAATLDDEMSVRELSRPASLVLDEPAEEGNGEASHKDAENSTQSKEDASGDQTGEAAPSKAIVPGESLTISTDPKQAVPQTTNPQPDSDTSSKTNDKEEKGSSQDSLAPEQVDSATGSFENLLPTDFSKVAHAFRVNEWSKHLSSAEKPDMDQIPEPGSPGIKVDTERPAPVSDELTRPLSVHKRSSKRISSGTTNTTAFVRSNSDASMYSQATRPTSVYRSASGVAGGAISRSGSQVHIRPSRNSRTSSAAAPAPFSTNPNTLMSQRETLMRNRPSSQSFAPLPGAASSPNHMANDEEMTLSQRKRALQHHHQKPPSASQKWQQRTSRSPVPPPNPYHHPNNTTSTNPSQIHIAPNFNSHPPQRNRNSATDQKREDLLAGWRQSINNANAALHGGQVGGAGGGVGVAGGGIGNDEQRRAALIQAKRQKEAEEHQREVMAMQRESRMLGMMRSGEMLGAHREALRRLQQSAAK
ncbi:hypothetical protein DM02DRAFT_285460 [Periconia macrospinosa]|uniref:TM7S3/TM198-like domain-containing protein n=1 Tax=Periconia macrospinosa TaxID=97972 RepID=A0A2V1EAR8_9PLEO|nr:hypothetical protein DM02DRAFT_285460 [Periconia macrospinosa]